MMNNLAQKSVFVQDYLWDRLRTYAFLVLSAFQCVSEDLLKINTIVEEESKLAR